MFIFRLIIYFSLFIFVAFTNYQSVDTKNKMSYTETDILKELDSISGVKLFPSFEVSYFYPSNCRINLFADKNRWAIVFEILSYNTMGYNIVIDNYYFSNCFINSEKHNNTNISRIILSQIDDQDLMDDENFIKYKSKYISIRNQKYLLPLDIKEYKQNDIRGFYFSEIESKIDIVSLSRLMAIKTPDVFKASSLELKKNLPKDLPFLGAIEDWHHCTYMVSSVKGEYIGKKPSTYETFQLIAKCIVNRSLEFYKPTLLPNSNWRNWPNAGQL